MKYLLHGNDTVSSRNYLTSLIEGLKATILDGKSLKTKDFEEKLASKNLFGEKIAFVVENLFSKNPKKKDFIKFLNEQSSDILTIFWEDKKLLKTSFSGLKEVEMKEFFLPQNYFAFLDGFVQGNGKRLFGMYHELLKTMTEEQIFYSLLKRLRLLVVINSRSSVAELEKMSDWQLSKLNNQARQWKSERLIEFYKAIRETEIKLKTGKLPLGLSKHLDTMILSELT